VSGTELPQSLGDANGELGNALAANDPE
jgi:hypothetical protein